MLPLKLLLFKYKFLREEALYIQATQQPLACMSSRTPYTYCKLPRSLMEAGMLPRRLLLFSSKNLGKPTQTHFFKHSQLECDCVNGSTSAGNVHSLQLFQVTNGVRNAARQVVAAQVQRPVVLTEYTQLYTLMRYNSCPLVTMSAHIKLASLSSEPGMLLITKLELKSSVLKCSSSDHTQSAIQQSPTCVYR